MGGSKERLLGEGLWSFAEDGLAQATAAATGTGTDYILDGFERFNRMNAIFPPLRRFLEQEPQLALRLLTSKHSPVQGRRHARLLDGPRRQVVHLQRRDHRQRT